MNKYILALFLAAFSVTASAQKLYFVYLQSEADQPFYVKLNDKVHSSSASGYLILSKLRDTAYSITLGFAQNKGPEQNFSININRKDHGYLIKNFGEKGWGLFDLQTLEVIMAAGAKAAITRPDDANESGFTAILSKAADDPSLKEKQAPPIVVEKKSEIAAIKEEPQTENGGKTGTKGHGELISAPLSKEKQTQPAITENKPGPPVVMKEDPQNENGGKTGTKGHGELISAPLSKEKQTQPAITENKPEPPVVKDAAAKTAGKEDTETKPEEKKDVQSVKQEATVTAPPPAPVVAEPVKEEAKAAVKESPAITEISSKEEVKQLPLEEYKMSTVVRRSESSTTEGFGLVYLDKYDNGSVDTVRLLIPNPKPAVMTIKEEPKEEKKMLDIPVEVVQPTDNKPAEEKPAEVKPAETNPEITAVPETKPAAKTNCPEVAAEPDFFKLRKAMAAAENDDDMISEAKKYFKTKCFTTAQVKNLGALFLTDQGKYSFYDVAYPYAADAGNYSTLQTELREEYYINRFRAMLRN
jgi:hypothetical protein